MASLLLVDSNVRMYTQIVEAAKPSTVVIVFNRLTSSLDDVVKQIEALPNRAFTSVGLVQDGANRMLSYRIVNSQDPCALLNLEAEGLASWSPVIAFLQSLQSLTGMATFDFISCLLNSNPGFSYAISQISAQLGVTLQASSDTTGNLAQGGNWVQESDAVNIKDVYFTDAIMDYMGLLSANFMRSFDTAVTQTNTGFLNSAKPVRTMITFSPGSIAMWGYASRGGNSTFTGSDYKAIVSSDWAIAALKSDGTIYARGSDVNRGGTSPTGTGYTAIAAGDEAFAALKSDGTIYAWGTVNGGINGGSGTAIGGVVPGSGYIAIASTFAGFAGLKSNGTIYSWGDYTYASGGAPSDSGYIGVSSNSAAFAALNSSGRIYTWGWTGGGGNAAFIPGSGYTAVIGNYSAFAALKLDGTIYAWGYANYGGSMTSGTGYTGAPTGSGYTMLVAGYGIFGALNTNGTVVSWGANLNNPAPTGSDYIAIASNNSAFAALNSSGRIYAWGTTAGGGIGGYINGTGYTTIYSNTGAFAAMKSDGSIYAWGDAGGGVNGGSGTTIGGLIPGSGHRSIAWTYYAFAALKSDGSVYAWGDVNYGGAGAPTGTGYTSIASNTYTFAAITSTVVSSGVACFVKGTRLLSQNGYKAIDKFSSTDLLITSDGRTVDFELLSTTIAKTDEDTAPYVIHPHAFGRNVPIAPLYLSPTHMVMFRKGLWTTPAIAVLTNPLVKRCPIGESVTYYHVKCEDFLKDNVLAEGMVAESLGTKKGLGNVKIIYTWNKKLGGYTRIAPRAMLKNKASSTA